MTSANASICSGVIPPNGSLIRIIWTPGWRWPYTPCFRRKPMKSFSGVSPSRNFVASVSKSSNSRSMIGMMCPGTSFRTSGLSSVPGRPAVRLPWRADGSMVVVSRRVLVVRRNGGIYPKPDRIHRVWRSRAGVWDDRRVEPAPARLRLRRTGGLAGLPVEAALDTADLAPAEAEPLLAALDAARLDSPEIARLAGGGAPRPGAPDAFGYELEVTRGADTRRLRFGELDMPDSLRALVALLGSRAKPAGR